MADLLNSLSVTASGLTAQAKRIRYISENIANVDTPGYRRKQVTFETDHLNAGRVETGKMRLDQTQLKQEYDPAHPLAGTDGYYQGSNVNLLFEMADAREANQSYKANLQMFEHIRKMQTDLLSLLK